MYLEKNESGSAKEGEPYCLLPTPGLVSLVTLATAGLRALWTASNGYLYAVSANKLYKVDSSWSATLLGTLLTSSGVVSMVDNGTSLCAVDGTYGYVVTLSSDAFAQITDPAFMGADRVDYIDGYFVFNRPGTQEWYISGLISTDFDALDFASAEASPDELVTLFVLNRQVYLLGLRSTEVWYDAGAADFPFQRIEGQHIEVGCSAKHSVAKLGNNGFWLGQSETGSGIVYMVAGGTPQRISTHAIEAAIQGYGDISDAVGFCYQDSGHGFYVLNFPTADATWVFDVSTGSWHERAYLNPSTGQEERHRAACHAFAYGVHVVGDYETGDIYRLDGETYDDAGDAILRLRSSPHISKDMLRLFFTSFQLDLEVGVGLDGTGQGTDPQIMLDYSDDGGHTWSNERLGSAGRIGARLTRAIWRRLGYSRGRDRVFRVRMTDPVKFVILGAEVELETEAA